MHLKEGCKDSLVKYYEDTWSSIEEKVEQSGVFDYSVFLDEENNNLFVVNKYCKGTSFQTLTEQWWEGMTKYLEPISGDTLYVELEEFMYLNDFNNDDSGEVDAQRYAFRLHVTPGYENEIRKRQQADFVWETVKNLLSKDGVYDYSIYWDEQTNYLYAVQKYFKGRTSQENDEIDPDMQLWWDMMSDIMDTNADNSPVSIKLVELFDAEKK